jgi:hypothetical protein
MAEAGAVASALVFRALLPPHPALSLGLVGVLTLSSFALLPPHPGPLPGERENRPPLRGESNALGRAGVSALNR